MKRLAGALLLLLLVAFFGVGAVVERFLNQLEPVALPAVSEAARTLHASSLVADMHADSLLTGRDLLRRSRVGHVDLPRLHTSQLAVLTQQMLAEGFSDASIRKILGANVVRVLGAVLPER